jgi:hypothetical protein
MHPHTLYSQQKGVRRIALGRLRLGTPGSWVYMVAVCVASQCEFPSAPLPGNPNNHSSSSSSSSKSADLDSG